MICPKCKKENDDNALICSSCGFKLKLPCPHCGSYNHVGAKICSTCNGKLLKVCPECKAVNFIQVKQCRKCKAEFNKFVQPQASPVQTQQVQQQDVAPVQQPQPEPQVAKQQEPQVVEPQVITQPAQQPQTSQGQTQQPQVQPQQTHEQQPQSSNQNLLDKAAIVAIDLINLSSIKTNIKSEEISQKIITKFYQIFAKIARDANLKPLKLNESTLVVSFANSPSFIDSVNSAVSFIETLDRTLDSVSEQLEKKLKITYKVRYLAATFKTHQKKDILSAISLGVVDDIIFSQDIHSKLQDRMLFKEVDSINGEIFYKFLDENDPDTIVKDLPPKEPPAKNRMQIVTEMVDKVQMATEGFIVCMNGPTGVGKSNIFSALKMTFDEDNSNTWIIGQCPLFCSTAPLAFFRNLLKTLFDIPSVNIDSDNTKTTIASYLTNNLGITSQDVINQIIAIVFPDENKLQNSIYQNKQNTYGAIASIFRALLNKGALVLQIEDIERIDSFSLEIFRNLFDEGILKCNLKIFATSNMDIDIIQFFASSHVNKNNTHQVNYPAMNKDEIDDFIIKAIGVREELGQNILNHIYENSQNLPVFIEEFLYSLLQLGIVKFTNDNNNPIYISPEISNFNFPKTVQEIIQLRLTNISNVQPVAFKTLYYASILGFKFLPAVIQNILQISQEEFQETIKYLSMNNFITPVDTYNYTFKSRLVWETIRNLQLSEENQKAAVTAITNTLMQLTMPDMADVVENLLSVSVPKYDILNYIEQTTKEAYCIGDDYAYVYYKSMLLEAVDLSTLENKQAIQIAIKEELLGITYMTFPDKAIKYAEDLYVYYSEIDEAKTIDILGVMSVAFENIGNYLAAIECVDKALEKIDADVNKVASMLLHYSKLNALLQLGRYEEVITIAKNNVLAVLDLYNKNKTPDITTLASDDIKTVELETMYILAQAYALKGSPFALDAAQKLYDLSNEIVNPEYTLKSKFAKATILLLQGKMDEVQGILENVQEFVPNSKDATLNTFIWLLLKNACAYFKGNYSSMISELNMLANFSANVKKFALEPVVRGFLVQILLHEGKTDEAEQLAYDLFYKCSNNQWALGALVNWYMYCEIAIFKENYDVAIKVAQNALDVAEKANTNNLFFISLLKLKIAQIYSLRGDFDIAKINAQEAIQMANDNNYTYVKVLHGIVMYEILLKQIQENPSLKNENISLLYKYLLSSQEAVDELKNAELSVNIKQRVDGIFNYAQENNIAI